MKRYYFGRRKDGYWYVNDRVLELSIARCQYREQATLVAISLNEYEALQIDRMAKTDRVTP